MIIPTIRGVLFFVTLISIMDVLRTFDQLIPLAPQAVEIGNESIMFYIYNIAFREGSEALGLGSAISVLTILLILIMLVAVHPGHLQGSEERATMTVEAEPTVSRRPPKVSRRRAAPGAANAAPRLLVLSGLFLAATCFAHAQSRSSGPAMSVTKPTDVAFVQPAGVHATARRFQAFVDLWQTTYFAQYLGNTLIVAVITTVIAPGHRHCRRRTRCRGRRATSRRCCWCWR